MMQASQAGLSGSAAGVRALVWGRSHGSSHACSLAGPASSPGGGGSPDPPLQFLWGPGGFSRSFVAHLGRVLLGGTHLQLPRVPWWDPPSLLRGPAASCLA